jgi:hypothetical protein
MRTQSPAEPHASLRSRLTDHHDIAARVALLRADGHGELSIWRYFLDSFVVDLDALSLIMAELFGRKDASGAMPAAALGYREAA